MSTHSQIAEIIDRYQAAVLARDAEALLSLYDERVQVFDQWGAWRCDGREAWRASVAQWFGSIDAGERVVVQVHDLHVDEAQDLAAAHAVFRFAAVDDAGKTLRWLDSRMTLVLRRRAGAWAIVHEHSSAPIDHETLKARLQRPAA